MTPYACLSFSNLQQLNAGENGFKTSKTGFAGLRNMVVGFEAPGLVYYRSEYNDVSSDENEVQNARSPPGCVCVCVCVCEEHFPPEMRQL